MPLLTNPHWFHLSVSLWSLFSLLQTHVLLQQSASFSYSPLTHSKHMCWTPALHLECNLIIHALVQFYCSLYFYSYLETYQFSSDLHTLFLITKRWKWCWSSFHFKNDSLIYGFLESTETGNVSNMVMIMMNQLQYKHTPKQFVWSSVSVHTPDCL